jgi:uncharacterized protein
MFFNPFYFQYWWVTIPGILLALYAQFKLSSTYGRYSQVENQSGLSGAEAARRILDNAGLSAVPIEEIAGNLTDHYDPTKKTLFLSAANYEGRSIAAVGVAAHEAGHALQQQAAYALFNFRMFIVPVTQFATFASYGLFFLGMLLTPKLALFGILLFAITTLFQVFTLPVEYDASSRAKQQLLKLGLVRPNEAGAVSSVLSAAALTYVAAMLTSILTLLRFIMIFNRNNRD